MKRRKGLEGREERKEAQSGDDETKREKFGVRAARGGQEEGENKETGLVLVEPRRGGHDPPFTRKPLNKFPHGC